MTKNKEFGRTKKSEILWSFQSLLTEKGFVVCSIC